MYIVCCTITTSFIKDIIFVTRSRYLIACTYIRLEFTIRLGLLDLDFALLIVVHHDQFGSLFFWD